MHLCMCVYVCVFACVYVYTCVHVYVIYISQKKWGAFLKSHILNIFVFHQKKTNTILITTELVFLSNSQDFYLSLKLSLFCDYKIKLLFKAANIFLFVLYITGLKSDYFDF